jgi:hypothetical protein
VLTHPTPTATLTIHKRTHARTRLQILETKTLERADGPVISVRLKPGRRGKGKRKRGSDGTAGGASSSDNSHGGGQSVSSGGGHAHGDGGTSGSNCYTVFVLQKRDIDQLTALDLLSEALG